MKLGRPVSDIDVRPRYPTPTGSPKHSGRRLPSEKDIREAELSAHEYSYPDLPILRKEADQPAPPDITTLPRRHAGRKQRWNRERSDSPLGKRSLSVQYWNGRKQENPIQRKNVSMKVRLYESQGQESESEYEEYLYPEPSPKQSTQKYFFQPKPSLTHKPDILKKAPVQSNSKNISHVDNARNFLSVNLQRKIEIAGKPSPRPWKPQTQQPSSINSPSEYVDMGNFKGISLSSENGRPVGTVKLRPVGKVVGKVAPSFEKIKEVQQISFKTAFNDFSVTELVVCLRKCGLWEMAEICQAEKLDGAFVSEMSSKELKEFNLTPLQAMKLNKVKSGWRPVTTQLL